MKKNNILKGFLYLNFVLAISLFILSLDKGTIVVADTISNKSEASSDLFYPNYLDKALNTTNLYYPCYVPIYKETKSSIKKKIVEKSTTKGDINFYISENKKTEIKDNSIKVSGYSYVLDKNINNNIISYVDEVCNTLEKRTGIELNKWWFLSLIYQESKFDNSLEDGICQIIGSEPRRAYCNDKNGGQMYITVYSRNDEIKSIEYSIISYIGSYQKILKTRKSKSVSPLYVLKIHNNGSSLIKLRNKTKYPLNADGDLEYIKAFENFEKNPKLFLAYLENVNSDYAKKVIERVKSDITYSEYIEGPMFSDPKYINNLGWKIS